MTRECRSRRNAARRSREGSSSSNRPRLPSSTGWGAPPWSRRAPTCRRTTGSLPRCSADPRTAKRSTRRTADGHAPPHQPRPTILRSRVVRLELTYASVASRRTSPTTSRRPRCPPWTIWSGCPTCTSLAARRPSWSCSRRSSRDSQSRCPFARRDGRGGTRVVSRSMFVRPCGVRGPRVAIPYDWSDGDVRDDHDAWCSSLTCQVRCSRTHGSTCTSCAGLSGPLHAEAFVFATRLTRLTRFLTYGRPDQAYAAVAEGARDWSGGTRIGAALTTFLDDHGRRGVARGAVVVIVSDGWERGDSEQLARSDETLGTACESRVWVNPRMAAREFQPLAGGMAAALPYVDSLVSGHSVRAVEEVLRTIREGRSPTSVAGRAVPT